jgi:prevent-host-death family protein
MASPKGPRKAKEQREEIPALLAKRKFGELLSRVGFGNERIAITRHGKKVAALVSAQDLETLDGAA